MLIAEIKDYCGEARNLFTLGKPEAGLTILDKVITSAGDPAHQRHPLFGVVFALKAELLQSMQTGKPEQVDCIAHALSVAKEHLDDDFESVSPILLNIVRYHVKNKQMDYARSAVELVVSGCNKYYGPRHPRLFQLSRWIEEAGFRQESAPAANS